MAKLTASDATADHWFGFSVSASGDHAVVGAPYGAAGESAYVFERDAAGTWVEVAKLIASDGAAGDEFGDSVAVDGDRLLVGARFAANVGVSSGAAYVFERDAGGRWNETLRLAASDAVESQWFGDSVSISGDRQLVGATGDTASGAMSGAAYLFEPGCFVLRGPQPDLLVNHALVTATTWTDTDATAPELYYQTEAATVLFVTASADGPLLSW